MTELLEGAGVALALHDHGPAGAPPVLVVHGLAADGPVWAPVAADLAAGGLRAITYDRRGYGGSGAPEAYNGTTVAEQAEDAVALLDGLGVEDAILAGDGFGGLVALDVALRHPGRVRGLVVADAPLFAFVPDAAQELAAERALLEEALRSGGPAAAVAAWLGEDADPARVARAQTAFRGFFADYAGLASLAVTRRELRAVAVPTAVVTGSAASAALVEAADALAALLPDVRRMPEASLADGVRAVAG